MSEKKEKNLRVMRQLQHRAQLLNWIGEMPSLWNPWALRKWKRRMPKLRKDTPKDTTPEEIAWQNER